MSLWRPGARVSEPKLPPRGLIPFLCVCGVLLYYGAWLYLRPYLIVAPPAKVESSGPMVSRGVLALEQSGSQTHELPTDTLFITRERENYEDKSMTLRVPRLELTVSVYDGVEDEKLDQGVGLYDYSPLPNESINANVSIAGHRDIRGKEFYYIDRVIEGDRMYLDYKGVTYVYEYLETLIVENDDWSPIYCRSYPVLTLTSCDPIGTSLRRIILVGWLIGTIDNPAQSASSS